MEALSKNFELDFGNIKIKVQQYLIGGQTVFRITFPDKTIPLIVTRAQHFEAHNFWTSIPEGRQKEAEEIGALISSHLKPIL